MDVHLDQLEVADADDGIADAHELLFEAVYIGESGGFFQVDDEKLGAVGKLDLTEVEVDDV